jgi:two-component system, NarL family, response regulator NreC
MSSTVALIDDHPVFREGLRHLLAGEPGLEVVGEAGDARGACAIANSAKPSVIVIDVALPDGDGIAATQEILRYSPRTRVLALTMHTGEFFVSRAFSAGVSGYAIKTQAPEEIVGAVCAVARGETYVPARFSHLVMRPHGRTSVPTTPFEDLSKREREIFDLILRGFTNEGMSRALFISVKTVETHRSHINRKLRVHSTGELIRLAAMHGLLPQ